MTDKRVKVPEFMIHAAIKRHDEMFPGLVRQPREIEGINGIVEAAISALVASPIIPTDEQLTEAGIKSTGTYPNQSAKMEGFRLGVHWALEFQSHMFLSEPDVPEAIKDLLEMDPKTPGFNASVLEAYRRGRTERE